jgi:hypothetical protein
LPLIGELGKIYVTLADNATYRWGGSIYVMVGNTSDVITLEFMSGILSTTIYAHKNMKINSIEAIFNLPEILFRHNDLIYEFGNLILKGDSLQISVEGESVVNLNIQYV